MRPLYQRYGAVLVTVLALFLGGCLGSYGSLKISPALKTDLGEKGLNPEYNYYYCGRSGLPYAVVGIDPAWTFEDRFWFRIDSMDEVYHKIRNLADLEPGQFEMVAKDILAPDLTRVGTYFSYYASTPVTVDLQNRRVGVHNPYQPEEETRRNF